MSVSVRPYAPGDERAILDLFLTAFGKPLSMDYWNWRFRDNPVDKPRILLAWEGETLAAHYAVSPVHVGVAGNRVLSALSMTTMTHPNYRGQGLFVKLAGSLYSELGHSDYHMVWGFPNDQSHRGLVRDLAWKDIAEIPMLRLSVKEKKPEAISANISEIHSFDNKFDSLWRLLLATHRLGVWRDSNYLNWRLFGHPGNRYRVLAIIQNEEALGYTAWKRFGNDLDLVDFAAADASTARQLIQGIIDTANSEDMSAINAWVPLRDSVHHDFEKVGFRNTGGVTYFGVRLLAEPSMVDVTDPRQWHYAMIDSDVF